MRPVATLPERILAHLLERPVDADSLDVPRSVTQDGIAETLSARVAHVSRALRNLEGRGLVAARLAHPVGARRRSRAYSLTPEGRSAAAEVARGVTLHAVDVKARNSADRRAGARDPPPFVRRRELTFLEEAFAAAERDGPRIVLVEGDSGMGKSTLLAAFGRSAAAKGARVLEGRGAPVGDPQVLGALREALAGTDFESRYRAAVAGEPAERALDAACGVLARAARRGSVVILLDDVHLSGPGAAEFLRGVLLSLPAATPLLVVAAFVREETWELPNGPLYAALDPLRAPPVGSHLLVNRVERNAFTRFLRTWAPSLSSRLVSRVTSESGGNPLYALAMVEALADGEDEDDFFPPVVRALVAERFADLPADAFAVLRAAAVCGAEFEYDLLARVHEASESDLVDAVDLLRDRLLLQDVQGPSPERILLRFEHPKVRESVLASLSAPRRRWLAQRVIEADASLKAHRAARRAGESGSAAERNLPRSHDTSALVSRGGIGARPLDAPRATGRRRGA